MIDMTTSRFSVLREYSRTPEALLLLASFGMAFAMSLWTTLLNNFVIDIHGFTGREIGILHSLREIPGFLAFTAVFVLLLIKEQPFFNLSLLVAGLGVVATGLLPGVIGVYFATVLMSIGFHYFETLNLSLVLQWVDKKRSPLVFGRIITAKSLAAALVFFIVWLAAADLVAIADHGLEAAKTAVKNSREAAFPYRETYIGAGFIVCAIAVLCIVRFPRFQSRGTQNKQLLLRRRYGLFYALTLLSGARRQIFMVFAAFLLVEKFDYSATDIATLFFVNHLLSALIGPSVGRLVARFGDRAALVFEYTGLIGIFLGYAVVTDGTIAAGLYIADHLFFAFAIAIKSYLHKIAAHEDIASTAAVSFTISHIVAVVIPVAFGLVWLYSPALVFAMGAVMALGSLLLASLIPRHPDTENPIVPSFANLLIASQKPS